MMLGQLRNIITGMSPTSKSADQLRKERILISRQLDGLSNFLNLELLDQVCEDLDLGQDFCDYSVAIAVKALELLCWVLKCP